MAIEQTIEVCINVRWWVPHYIHSLVLFGLTFGVWPDEQKVSDFILHHGIKISFPKGNP